MRILVTNDDGLHAIGTNDNSIFTKLNYGNSQGILTERKPEFKQ